jgi:diadenylate cyclase
MHWPALPDITYFPTAALISLLDILAVAFLLYQFFTMIHGRRAFHIVAGLGVLAGIYGFAVVARFQLLRTLMETLAPYTAFGLIVIFQSEIRRFLARIGRRRWILAGESSRRREVAEEIALAVSDLAASQTGAIIVLERDIGLRTFIESGIRIDGLLSRNLLLTIFQPNGALHDGAVIVQGDRIAAAACFLPLSVNPRLASTMGTRHRAAVGISEESDCLAIVVSEETGTISVAVSGELISRLTPDDVERRIAEHFGRRELVQPATKPPEPAEPVRPAQAPFEEARR